MRDWIWNHALVGNDTHPAITAIARALVGASLTGALAFLVAWENTGDVQVLIRAGLMPFILYLLVRGGFEGVIDVRKSRRK